MYDKEYIKTVKIIYENKGNCDCIESCDSCPFDNRCTLFTRDKDKFKLAKKFLEEKIEELPIIKSEIIEMIVKGIRISYSKNKNVKITTNNNTIVINVSEEK